MVEIPPRLLPLKDLKIFNCSVKKCASKRKHVSVIVKYCIILTELIIKRIAGVSSSSQNSLLWFSEEKKLVEDAYLINSSWLGTTI